MTIHTEKEIRDLQTLQYSDNDSNMVLAFGESRPRIAGVEPSNKMTMRSWMDTKLLVGFVGFTDADSLKTFKEKHKKVGRPSPYSVLVSPTSSGLYIFRDPDRGGPLLHNEEEYTAYISFIEAHWDD